jgi:hypothetical protein
MIIHNQWAYNTEALNLKQIDPKAWVAKQEDKYTSVQDLNRLLPVIYDQVVE